MDGFTQFCEDQAPWLDTYALFIAIKGRMDGSSFCDWPPELRATASRRRWPPRARIGSDIEREKFRQYLFFRQWTALKKFCNERGIQINWGHPDIRELRQRRRVVQPGHLQAGPGQKPGSVGGVPPDYFSSTGQLWGNPVYNWDVLRQTGYAWWIERSSNAYVWTSSGSIISGAWSVLGGARERKERSQRAVGRRPGGGDFFGHLAKRFFNLPIIAEDLGIITPDVREVIEELGFPGMKVLLFAFGEDNPEHIYLPHTYGRNYVVYTGTHDNNTARGWFDNDASRTRRRRLPDYIGKESRPEEVHGELVGLAMARRQMAVFPFQDILGLGGEAQMNRPSIGLGNWGWRFAPERLTGRSYEQAPLPDGHIRKGVKYRGAERGNRCAENRPLAGAFEGGSMKRWIQWNGKVMSIVAIGFVRRVITLVPGPAAADNALEARHLVERASRPWRTSPPRRKWKVSGA